MTWLRGHLGLQALILGGKRLPGTEPGFWELETSSGSLVLLQDAPVQQLVSAATPPFPYLIPIDAHSGMPYA